MNVSSQEVFYEPGEILSKLTNDPWCKNARSGLRPEDALINIGILLSRKNEWILEVGSESEIEVRDAGPKESRSLAVMYVERQEIVFEARYVDGKVEYVTFTPGLWEDTVRLVAETLLEDDKSWQPFEVYSG